MKEKKGIDYKLLKILVSISASNFNQQLTKAFVILGKSIDASFVVLKHRNEILIKWENPFYADKLIITENTIQTAEKKTENGKSYILNDKKEKVYLHFFYLNPKKTYNYTLIFGFLKEFSNPQFLKKISTLIFNTIKRIENEKTLREENNNLRTLLNAIPDIICFKDANGRWIEANKADLKLFKLKQKQVKGKKDSELAEYAPFFKEAFLTCEITDRIAMQKKRKSRSIEEIPQPDGTTKIFDVYKIPVLNKDKSLKGLIVYGRDITCEKKIKNNLQQQLAYSEKIISIAENILKYQNKKEIINHIANESGKTLSLDQCYIFEFNRISHTINPVALWKKKNKDNFVFEKNFSAEHIRKLLEQGKNNKKIIESFKTNPHPLISNAKLDNILHKELGIKSLFFKQLFYSYPYILFIIGVSLSEEKKLTRIEKNYIYTISKLIEMEIMKFKFLDTIKLNLNEISKLASMIEQAQEIFVLTDTDGKIKYVNPQFEKITGFSSYEVLGKNTKILKSGQHSKEFYKQLWDTIKKGKKWEGKLVNKRKNGEIYIEWANIYPIKNLSGKITNYCKIARDITKETILKKRLKHAQHMEALATLARGIAHDFNNIVTSILMNINMAMLFTENQQEIKSYIENIKLAAEQASLLVKQLLSFAKENESKKEQINLCETIRNSLKLLKTAMPKNIKLVTKIENSNKKLLANKGEINQIFMNLCNNAIQAMKNGGILTVKLEQIVISEDILKAYPEINLKLNHEYFKLCIIDTGMGIPENIKDKIFEPFFTTKGDKGTGLGLSIVHQIVTSYGGEIFFKSKEGEGTTFEIFLPIAKD